MATPDEIRAVFNVTAQNYTGPIFGDAPYGPLELYIATLKVNCSLAAEKGTLVGKTSRIWNYFVSECVWRNMNEQEKSNLAASAYTLTLWPAFLALFASLGPDAGDAAWDSILWGGLLALTSGGMAGFHSPPNVPHHIRVADLDTATLVCRQGEAAPFVRHLRNKVGRFSPRRKPVSAGFAVSQWFALLLPFAAYVYFLYTFIDGLNASFRNANNIPPAVFGVWFFVASAPAIAEGLARTLSNNVELYERAASDTPSPMMSPQPKMLAHVRRVSSGIQPAVPVSALASPLAIGSIQLPEYVRVDCSNGFSTWKRIIANQLAGYPYRLLVHPYRNDWLPDGWRLFITFGRFVILIVGSALQGAFTVYPPGRVVTQSALIAVFSAIPRIIWPNYWVRARRGADLVVFVQPPLASNLDDITLSP